MNLSFADLLNDGKDWTLKSNPVGYLYNLKEQKYLNCNNVTVRQTISPILVPIPSAPWTVNIKKETGKHIFVCGNKQVIDIAWSEYIISYPRHERENQQFGVEMVKSIHLDEIILNWESSGKKTCFTSKVGRIMLNECEDKTNNKSGQHWYWIPEILMNELVFKPMRQMLES